MRITIAGYGYVGRAIEALMYDADIETKIVDPNYYRILGKDLTCGLKIYDTKPSGVIICVSTPQSDTGACDISNVCSVIEDTDSEIPILIKSTISLEGWNEIKKKFPKHIIAFSPEFLRASTAIQDLRDTKEILIGGDDLTFWIDLFKKTYKHEIKFLTMPVNELILIKYFRNAFLATKVSFFNQIYDLCEATGIDYENVAQGIGMDTRIGNSHTKVNTSRGYGGHCFPKDVKAILATAKANNVNLSLINKSQQYNNTVRKEI